MLVLLDRFVDSSLAYQGAGRALGVEQVRAINLFATGPVAADRTLLLRIAPADGRARQQRAGARARPAGARGRAASSRRSPPPTTGSPLPSPARFRVIDATPAPQQVLEDALAAVEDLLT